MAETKEDSALAILAPWRADLIELWGEKYVAQMEGDWLDPRKLDKKTVRDIHNAAERSRNWDALREQLLADLDGDARQWGVAGASAAHRDAAIHDTPPTFDQFADLAHAYGEGPITVSPKYDPSIAHPRRDLTAIAKAVAAWNRATGTAMFRLVDDQDADIVISIHSNSSETETGNAGAAGTGAPAGWSEGQTQGDIDIYDEETRVSLYKHEIGHTLGLAHSGEGTDTYADKTGVMGSGKAISAAEAATVRANLGESTRTLSPSHVPPPQDPPDSVRREARKNRRRAKDPTPGSAPGR